MRNVFFAVIVILGLLIPCTAEARPRHDRHGDHRPHHRVVVTTHVPVYRPPMPYHLHGTHGWCAGHWIWLDARWEGPWWDQRWRPGHWQWVN